MLLLILVYSVNTFAQTDTTIKELTVDSLVSVPQDSVKKHSPAKASIYSAVLPGLGQIYNRKFWKVPLVYGLLTGTVLYARQRTIVYRDLREAYVNLQDGDPTTPINPNYTIVPSELNSLQQTARDQRDRSYLFILGAYVLQIIDANVDAHLFNFDVSDDLTLYVHPYTEPAAQLNCGLRLTLKL